MMDFTYLMPTKVVFGKGCVKGVGDAATELNAKKILVVTGKTSMKKTGVLDRVIKLLSDFEVEVFDKVESDPSTDTVDEGAEIAKKYDTILGLGGGSPLDAAKAISLVSANGGDTKKIMETGYAKIKGPDIIAIPTTAGTAAEITMISVLTNRDSMVKKSIRNPYLYPAIALDDVELTLTMPAEITVQTGLDALSHALEALVSTRNQPISDILCIEAAAKILKNIESTTLFGNDLMPRTEMLLASLMAGYGITNAGAGLAHGLSYGLWKASNIGHGLACGMLMPHVMEYNRKHVGDRYNKVAKKIGLENDKELIGLIFQINERLNVPKNLGELNIVEEDVPGIVDVSLGGAAKTNPRKVDVESAKMFLEDLL